MADFVLDTSAVLTLRADEAGADRVEEILRRANDGRCDVLLSFMTRMEILYRVMVDEDEEAARSALRLLDSTGIRWVTCEEAILEAAAQIKAGGAVSVADAWIAATALYHDAILVHKDPDFERLRDLRQERL